MDRRDFLHHTLVLSTSGLSGNPVPAVGMEVTGNSRKCAVGGNCETLSEQELDLAWVNVKHFGAKGDGSSDDTTAIQKALNFILTQNPETITLFFPAGDYIVIDQLISPVNFSGLVIKGAGKRGSFREGANRRGTLIHFRGIGTLFAVASGSDLVVEDIGFIGSGTQTCFKFTQPGNGAGMSTFTRVHFDRLLIGVQFGESINDGGCADVGFDFCTFTSCEVGVKVKNLDGANYSFNRLYANNCRTVISSVPGSFNLTNSQLVSCGSEETNIFEFIAAGDNSGFVLIQGMRFEQGCKRLLSMSGKGRLQCVGLEEAQSPSGTVLFNLKGVNGMVSLSRFTSGEVEMPLAMLGANAGGQRSHLVFSQVYFSYPAEISIYQKIVGFIDSGFLNSYKCDSCTAGVQSAPIMDMGGRVQEGKVLLCGQTTNESTIELTVTGSRKNQSSGVSASRDFSSAEVVVFGVTRGGVARFIRQIIWSKAGVKNIQAIGLDVDTVGTCSVGFAIYGNGLVINVAGPRSEMCTWHAVLTVLATGTH